MPLEAAFAALDINDHSAALAADDHAFLHAAGTSTVPTRRISALPTIATSLKDAEEEEHERSLMQIARIGPPDRAKLEDLNTGCKFDNFVSVFGDGSEGADATRSAKELGKAVTMSANCVANTSDLVLNDIFGHKLKASGGGMGVELEHTHDIPLGSLSKKAIKSSRASCQDFGDFLLRRFEKPGDAPKCAAAGGVDTTVGKFTQRDATHALKSYGLCLDTAGETAALQGCEMGNLQRMGSVPAANLCKVAEGPIPPEIMCTIL